MLTVTIERICYYNILICFVYFCGQKHPQGATAMKRSATALAVPDASMNNPHGQLRRLRSFSTTEAKGLAFIQNKILEIYSAESSEKTLMSEFTTPRRT
jgi:hypothetical protein